MNSAPYNLTEFEDEDRSSVRSELASVSQKETAKIYEDGYRDGWDDCVSSQKDTEKSAQIRIAESAERSALTIQEVTADIQVSLGAFLTEISCHFVPSNFREQMRAAMCGEISRMVQEGLDHHLHVVANPKDAEILDEILATQSDIEFTVLSNDSAAEGQIFYQVGATEKLIDFNAVTLAAQNAIRQFILTELSEQ